MADEVISDVLLTQGTVGSRVPSTSNRGCTHFPQQKSNVCGRVVYRLVWYAIGYRRYFLAPFPLLFTSGSVKCQARFTTTETGPLGRKEPDIVYM